MFDIPSSYIMEYQLHKLEQLEESMSTCLIVGFLPRLLARVE